MAMVVQHNAAAQLALGELNKNVSKVGKLLTKLSTGQKINSAQDDSASFCISEKMREQIRSLLQDNQNVQNGSALFKVADGGISSIVEELRNLKELAINSANDTNTDVDRLTIQKEFSQKMANINDIATETNYNGKALLDGTYVAKHGRYETQFTKRREWVPPGRGSSAEIPAPPYSSIYRRVVEETDTDTAVAISGDYTISEDGIYSIEEDFSGTITVEAQNVKIVQTYSGTLSDVSIVGPEDGNANLWIEGLKINNTQAQNIIQFQGSGNVLTIRGANTLSNTSSDSSSYAVINIGDGLTVQGNNSSSLTINNNFSGLGAGIGTNSRQTSTGDVGIVNANISLNMYHGAGIGSGANGGSVGKITVENSSINLTGRFFAGIGSGMSSSCGDIWVVGSNVNDTYSVDTCIGSGFANASCGNIYVLNSDVYAHNSDSPCIGAGDAGSTCGNIFISHTEINSYSNHGAGVGSGRNSTVNGDIFITNGTAITHESPEGAAIGTGLNGQIIGTINITQSSLNLLNSSKAYSDGTHRFKGIGRGYGGTADNVRATLYNERPGYWRDVYDMKYVAVDEDTFNPLTIHHGTQANQAINFFIEDMHTKSLGTGALLSGGLPADESDLERYYALGYDKNLQQDFLRTLSNASYKTLDDIEVTTQFDANIAIRVLDSAIEYALNEATRIGSYLQRLNYTDVNITTMGENVQSAESLIRDADMAKEMTEYTKFNILTQSAQAMLAQANQNSSGVLSLLQ